jgi:tetratricopeptide (TPR) repeat protein
MEKPLWYKRTTWTNADREDFLSRLKRARQNTPLYLQMQAEALQQTGDPKLIEAALELINNYIENWSSDLALPQIYLQKAECLATQGYISEVVTAFRNAIESNRTRPNILTAARAKFALFVLKHELKEFYSEALTLLREPGNLIVFQSQAFQRNAALALLLDYQGDKTGALSHAQSALKAASIKSSGLPRHSQLGLVSNPDTWIIERLNQIVGI